MKRNEKKQFFPFLFLLIKNYFISKHILFIKFSPVFNL